MINFDTGEDESCELVESYFSAGIEGAGAAPIPTSLLMALL